MANEGKQMIDLNVVEKKLVRKALNVYLSTIDRSLTKVKGEDELESYYLGEKAKVMNVLNHVLFKE